MNRHIEIHHRSDIGRTAVRHYIGNTLARTERMEHDTLVDAMTFAYITADDSDVPVAFFIDGIEFSIGHAKTIADAFTNKPAN